MQSSKELEGDLNTPQEEAVDVQLWLDRIKKARNKEQPWRDRARKIVKIYRDDNTVTNTTYSSPRPNDDTEYCFNVLYSNTETLEPALFSAIPKPDVRNRYLRQDKVAEAASQVIERALSYSMDMYRFTKVIKSTVKDYLLVGRGQVRVRLNPQYEMRQVPVSVDEMGMPVYEDREELVGQEVCCEEIDWDSFVIEPCKRWTDVTWIAFVHLLTKEEFLKYFPRSPLIEATKETDQFACDDKYRVYEIWDKNKKKVYFIGQSEKPLDVKDDPLKLTNFWPCPEPIYSIRTSDTLVPIPEYTLYQTQAQELNQISYRISDLIRSCRAIGIYDSGEPNMKKILESKDSDFVAVAQNRMQNGGMKNLIDLLDVGPLAKVLAELYQERAQIKSIIDEITGISDILRGEGKPSETATAQNIKASYAGLRLRDRRDEINAFIVEVLRIKAELLCTFFPIPQLEEMSGIQITPDVQRVLKSDILRNYSVDIETDSTIMPDMQVMAQQRAAMVGSITQFLTAITPLVAQGAVPIETAKALLMFAVQPAKISRELEDALELIGTQPLPQPMGPSLGGGGPLPQGGVPPTGVGIPSQLPPELMPPQQLPPG